MYMFTSHLYYFLTRPTGLPKYSKTGKDIKQYYTPNALTDIHVQFKKRLLFSAMFKPKKVEGSRS